MKVSVVIPVYNEEAYIQTCLESLLEQTYKPFEILLVDNNCKDKTIDIAKGFPVTIVKEETQGMIPARNRGFNEAKGDIIARTDADAILPSDWIEKIIKKFSKEDVDAFTGPVIMYDLGLFNKTLSMNYLKLLRILLGHDVFIGGNMILTKNVWEKVKNKVCLDDSKVHEDIDISIHLHKVGATLKVYDDFVVQASARRIKNNSSSFFFEYPVRLIRTILRHV